MRVPQNKTKSKTALTVVLIFFAAVIAITTIFCKNTIDKYLLFADNEQTTVERVEEDSPSVSVLPQNQSTQPATIDKRVQIDFLYDGKNFRYTDDYITPTDHLVAETIHNRKINSSLDEKLRMVERCLGAGASYKDAVLYTFPLLEKTVGKISKTVNCDPVDSTIKFRPDSTPMFSIAREKVGFELIEERLYQNIYLSMRQNLISKITVIPKVLQPSVCSYDHIKTTRLRARFTTDYSASGESRKHNIKLALSKINGTILAPGEEFSFNKTVGRRTEKNGFMQAKIIMNGEYVEGFGGGVCQASTTLYNCALRADLDVTSARNHSLTSSYVEPSFDAMVNSGSADLKFKNTGKGNVFIRAYGTSTTAIIEIYGTTLPYKIQTQSVVTERGDPPPDTEVIDTEGKYIKPPFKPGERIRVNYSHGSLKSEGYLLYYSPAGKLLEKKLIRKDTYKSIQGIVAIAPGDPTIESPSETDSQSVIDLDDIDYEL